MYKKEFPLDSGDAWHALLRSEWQLRLLILLCFPSAFMRRFKESCHLSHSRSQQQGQVEGFMLDEQCSWGVLKQRRRFDVGSARRRTKEVAATRRKSGRGQGEAAQGWGQPWFLDCLGACIWHTCVYMCFVQVHTGRKEKLEHSLCVCVCGCDCSSW